MERFFPLFLLFAIPLAAQGASTKRPIDPFRAATCEKIEANLAQATKQKISRATQYFTPLFEPGPDGKLQEADRRACINMEGSCIVGNWLYNWAGNDKPWGVQYDLREVKFKFGKGSGVSEYNTTNALDPCRTLAAGRTNYPAGTVIYVPSMKNKLCPQTQQPVDGCFIVGDVGGAINGTGRFDFFTGECANYNKKNNTCADPLNEAFHAEKNAPIYVFHRDQALARALRAETDQFINNEWRAGNYAPAGLEE